MSRTVCVLCVVAAGIAATATAGAVTPAANQCKPTLGDARGPFNQGTPPLRTKIGTGHVLTGVVLSSLNCRPLRGAQVQFWQSNKNGRYIRATSATVITNGVGRFRFEGPYPPSYEGRQPHIHIRVFARGYEPLLARYVPAEGARRGSVRLVLVPDAL